MRLENRDDLDTSNIMAALTISIPKILTYPTLCIKLCSYRQHLTRYHLSFCQMDGVSEELLGLWYLTRLLCQALHLQLSLCQIYGMSEELAVE